MPPHCFSCILLPGTIAKVAGPVLAARSPCVHDCSGGVCAVYGDAGCMGRHVAGLGTGSLFWNEPLRQPSSLCTLVSCVCFAVPRAVGLGSDALGSASLPRAAGALVFAACSHDQCARDCEHVHVPPCLQAIWIYTCYIHRFSMARIKDYYMMFLHHILTIGLICTTTFLARFCSVPPRSHQDPRRVV